jgi:hypothetical protein
MSFVSQAIHAPVTRDKGDRARRGLLYLGWPEHHIKGSLSKHRMFWKTFFATAQGAGKVVEKIDPIGC